MDLSSSTSSPLQGMARMPVAPRRRLRRGPAARQCLHWWRLQLTIDPFQCAAYRGFGFSPVAPGVRDLAADQHISALTVRGA
jgi:hypothetical protein